MRLTCIALSGDGKLKAVAIDSIIKAANEVDSWNDKKFRMLKKMPEKSKEERRRQFDDCIHWTGCNEMGKQFSQNGLPLPSATARTIVVKSSSARTTSAASLATSVPPLPIAMPISAACKYYGDARNKMRAK